MYSITKHFGHDRGYSVAFRQWRAKPSHCALQHGYSLAFTFVIEGDNLDYRNWLFSFGDFKEIKAWLDKNFDHKTLVAEDDPILPMMKELEAAGACSLNIMPHVGCEKIAEHIYNAWASKIGYNSKFRAILKSVTVAEHDGNSATYSNRSQ